MIALRPMREEEFARYREQSVREYAREKVRGEGLSQAEADRVAAESFEKLLPLGPRTEGQYLHSILGPGGEPVGALWFGLRGQGRDRLAFLYDIVVGPEHQGKGYGRQAMLLLEKRAGELGLKTVTLHVFGHNERARALYESLGYRITNLHLAKDLERPFLPEGFCDEWLAAWTGNRPEELIRFYAEDAFYSDPANPSGLSGRPALLAYFRKLLARNPEWRWSRERLHPATGGFFLKWKAEIPTPGGLVRREGLDLVRLRDRLIERNEVYFDAAPLAPSSAKTSAATRSSSG